MSTLSRLGVLVLSLAVGPFNADAGADAGPVAKAQSLLAAGEARTAAIELKNVLQANPQDARARWLLAKALVVLGDWPGAEYNLREAQTSGYPLSETLPLLARALAEQGKVEEVLAIELTGLPPAAEAAVLSAQGAALIGQNKPEDALVKLAAAMALDAGSVEARIGKARLLQQSKDLDAAGALLQAALVIDKTNADAWQQMGDLEVARGRLDLARDAYNVAQTNAPGKLDPLLKRALVRIDLGEFEDAQADIDSARKIGASHPDVPYAQGVLYYRLARYQEAQTALQEALAINPDHLGAQYYFAALQSVLGNQATAEDSITRYLAKLPKDPSARTLLGEIKRKAGDYQEAEQILRSVLASSPEDTEAINVLNAVLTQQGRAAEAVATPESRDLISGVELLAKGDLEGGTRLLEGSAGQPSLGLRAAGPLVYAYIRQGRFDRALEVARDQQKRYPKDAEPLLLAGMVHLAKQEPGEAEAAFQQAVRIDPASLPAHYNLALIGMLRGRPAVARINFENALAIDPGHLASLLALSSMDAFDGDESAMVEHLKRAALAHPQALRPKTLLANYYLKKGQPDQVPVVLVNLSPSEAQDPLVLALLGESQLALKAGGAARATLQQLVDIQPDSADARFQLARALVQVEDIPALRQELEKTLELKADHFAARVALTRLQLLDGQLAEAEGNLRFLKDRDDQQPDVLGLEVLTAKRQDDQPRLLRGLTQVFKVQPSSANLLELVRQQWRMGDRDGAIASHKQWITAHPDDFAVRLSLAGTYAAANQADLAAAQYRAVLDQSKDNVLALNDYAWFLRDSDPAQAMKYAVRANALAPNAAEIKDTLAVVLTKNGEAVKALEFSAQALTSNPRDPTFRYHNAMIRNALGQPQAAIPILRDLINQTDLQFPERSDALALLTRLQAAPQNPDR